VNQETKYKVLKILEKHPEYSQRQLAKELGVSLGKTHYILRSLIDIGWVKLENFQKSKQKWGYVYLLTPEGIKEKSSITKQFLLKKQEEYIYLKQEIVNLEKEVSQLK
jgi:EPS-associated MarR family transcriptional regulator